jgi:D-arabinose 1-dehydrogenase-like Zn-dependent alcohol dehydrogenase
MDGLMPSMKSGDILGHEFMGEVVDVGADEGAGRHDREEVLCLTDIFPTGYQGAEQCEITHKLVIKTTLA